MLKDFCFAREEKKRVLSGKKKKKTNKKSWLTPIAAIILCLLIIRSVLLSSSAILGDEEKASAFSVYLDENPTGGISVTLAAGSAAVCGVAAEISFNEEELLFVGAEMPQELLDQGFFLSAREEEGRVYVVVDGIQNTYPDTLVSFNFEPFDRTTYVNSTIDVSVIEAYFWNDGELESLRGMSECISVALSGDGGVSPRLLSSSVFVDRDLLTLELSGAFQNNCIAAGFEIFYADLSGMDSSGLSICRVLTCGTEEKRAYFSLNIPNKSRLCVVITPISYSRGQTIRGRETVILIVDGKIIG